jgi:glycosyltransferase involved in cell wall biosynthesis
MRWFHKHSGIVLTTTTSMKQTLVDRKFKTNILEWSRGVDTSHLESLTRNIRTGKPVVLFVGRVSREKNLEKLLELQREYSIIVVGDGPDRLYLENKYSLVHFVGYKTGTELFQYYLNADVFCFPSLTDTFGIVLIEALSAGTPVAAYPVTGPVDIITSGVNGYLGNHLKSNINACLKLDRQIVKKTSEKWTWKNCWDIFKENLCSVL